MKYRSIADAYGTIKMGEKIVPTIRLEESDSIEQALKAISEKISILNASAKKEIEALKSVGSFAQIRKNIAMSKQATMEAQGIQSTAWTLSSKRNWDLSEFWELFLDNFVGTIHRIIAPIKGGFTIEVTVKVHVAPSG